MPHRFCEDDWNAHSIKMCETSGQDADGRDQYRASKTLAEKAFWDAVKHSPVQLEGVTINPPLVLGPIIHQCDRSEQLNTSTATFYKWLDGQLGTTLEDFQSPAFSFVDVRDCARAHVLALLVPEAAGQRFITCNGSLTTYQYHRAAHDANPSLSVGPQHSIDDVKEAIQAAQDKCNVFPGDKATRVLDLSYTAPEDTLRDMAASLLRFLPSD